jgi:hypothetical protein
MPNLAGMQLAETDSENEDEEADFTAVAPPAPADKDSSIEDPFASDDEVQNPPSAPPEDYIMPTAGATVDALGEPVEEDVHAHGEIDIETEDVHKAKWERYKLEKAQLLLDGWSISKKGADGGISIGAMVRTKAQANRKEGKVVGQTELEEKKLWLVDFGDVSPEPMAPQKLVLVERNAEEYVWTLVEDSEPYDTDPAPEEYQDGIGLVGFDFPELFKPETAGHAYNFPYLLLLQKMWPGDWRQQLRQLNLKIEATNAAERGKGKKINGVSEQEWWVFIGIIISAGPQGKGGNKLWEKPSHHREAGRGMTHKIDYGPGGLNIMAFYRFKEIKAIFPWAFQDKSKDDDPWNMIMLMVDGYNASRHSWIAASARKTLDESMSAWCPQTSKAGGLPHLSFILRKPEPLGTEFKVIACAVTGKLSS